MMEDKIIVHDSEKTVREMVFSQPELLSHIFSYLDLYGLLACKLVSKNFLKFTKQNTLWHEQFRIYFPHIFKNFSDDALSIEGWYSKFGQIYQSEYIGKDSSNPILNKQLRKCITWVKENNQNALKKELPYVNFEALISTLGFFLVAEKNNQSLLNIFYEVLLDNYEFNSHAYSVGFFHITIACCQPKNVIKSAKVSWTMSSYYRYKDEYLFAVKWALLFGDVDSFRDLIAGRIIEFDLTDIAMCLLSACKEGQIDAIVSLLSFAKNELSYTDQQMEAVVSTKYPVYRENFVFRHRKESSYTVSVISMAVENGHTEIVELLIKTAQPILSGSLVHQAARRGYLCILQLLIKHDSKLVNAPDENAQTPFLLAAAFGHVPILNYLYNHHKEKISIETKTITGDDTQKHHDGKTALCWAAEGGYVQTVKWLLEKNANVYAKTTLGAMPIHLAAQNGHLAIIKILLDKDAELLNAQDNENQTPLIYTVDLKNVVERKDIPYQDRIYKTQSFLFHKTDCNTLNAKQFICFAAQKGWLGILRDIRNINFVKETGLNPVSLALEQGFIETPKVLLDTCPDLVNEPDGKGKLPIHYVKSSKQKALLEQYNHAGKVADINQIITQFLCLEQEQYTGYLESLYLAGQNFFDQQEAIVAFLQQLPPEKFKAFFQNAVIVGLLSLIVLLVL